MNIQHIKICDMQLKQCLERNLSLKHKNKKMAQLKKLGIRSEHSTKEDIPMANKQIER